MKPKSVLILEDSLIIAMEVEEILRSIGVEHVEMVANLDEAAKALDTRQPDFALLDVNLGEAMSFDFARMLRARDIPFGFVSGYSDTGDFPDDLQQTPLLVKPFDDTAMHDFLRAFFSSAG